MIEEIKTEDLIQGADETRFEYSARMQSMRHLYESGGRWTAADQAAVEEARAMDPGPVLPPPEVGPPIVLYSFGFDAEQLLTVYNALRTYLRASVQQDNEDLETIKQIAAILIDIKPRAVEASKHLTEKRNARAD